VELDLAAATLAFIAIAIFALVINTAATIMAAGSLAKTLPSTESSVIANLVAANVTTAIFTFAFDNTTSFLCGALPSKEKIRPIFAFSERSNGEIHCAEISHAIDCDLVKCAVVAFVALDAHRRSFCDARGAACGAASRHVSTALAPSSLLQTPACSGA